MNDPGQVTVNSGKRPTREEEEEEMEEEEMGEEETEEEEMEEEEMEEEEEPLPGSSTMRARQEILTCNYFWRITVELPVRSGKNTWMIDLHEALLRHRWVDAARLLLPALGVLEMWGKKALPEIYWKAGAEVMMNHPHRSIEQFSLFANRMKLFSKYLKLKVSLELTWMLLCEGQEEAAHRELQSLTAGHRDQAVSSRALLLDIVHGYCGLLHYYAWQKQKNQLGSRDGSADASDSQADSASLKEMHHSFRQASVNFFSVLQKPGVWDIFSHKYVEMLEFYGNVDDAHDHLENTAYDSNNPANPNAHVSLYHFLKRHDAPQQKLLSVLKVLHQLVPSHELMLEYSQLLRDSGMMQRESISVLMSLLDFSPWQRDGRAWQSLAELVTNCVNNGDRDWFAGPWEVRMDWWPQFCFHKDQAEDDFNDNPLLASNKATVARHLMGKKNIYSVRVWALEKKRPPRKKRKT